MKVVSVSMVRNEADIIETFVRYHCEIVDAMIIVDHASIDGTSAILERLRAEGLPLHLAAEDGAAHDQSRVVTQASRQAAGLHAADCVIPLDADEFLVSPGSSAVRAAVEGLALTADSYFRAPWITYIPTAADSPSERNVLKRIQHRLAVETGSFSKVIIPGELIRRRKAVVGSGNHGLERYGWIWHRKHRHLAATGLAVAHFPVRSVEQLVRKVLLGWPAILARAERKPGEGGHWELMFQRFRRGGMPTADELSALATSYSVKQDPGAADASELVLDPVPPVSHWFALKYEQAEAVSLVMFLTAALEQLAQSLADAKRGRRD